MPGSCLTPSSPLTGQWETSDPFTGWELSSSPLPLGRWQTMPPPLLPGQWDHSPLSPGWWEASPSFFLSFAMGAFPTAHSPAGVVSSLPTTLPCRAARGFFSFWSGRLSVALPDPKSNFSRSLRCLGAIFHDSDFFPRFHIFSRTPISTVKNCVKNGVKNAVKNAVKNSREKKHRVSVLNFSTENFHRVFHGVFWQSWKMILGSVKNRNWDA